MRRWARRNVFLHWSRWLLGFQHVRHAQSVHVYLGPLLIVVELP